MSYGPPGASVHRISRQEYWSELPVTSPRDFYDPGIKPGSPIFLLVSGQSLGAQYSYVCVCVCVCVCVAQSVK